MSFSRGALEAALQRREFFLLYQAQVAMGTGALAGIECAIRWRHPERGDLHAMAFVNDVPPSGLAPAFMRFLVDTATAQIAAWRREGMVIPRYSVNVWPGSVDRDLIDTIIGAASRNGLPAGLAEIESQPEATYDAVMCRRLQDFREAGIRVALDDFGEGSLHFGSLRDAPFDVVKIPVMFGRNAGRAYDDAVISAAIAFARAIGATTVAEGVETTAARDRLVELGCEIGQGYLWSRQVEAAALPATVAAIGIDGSRLARP